MADVRWSQQAASDLECITEFIAADSPHYASLFAMDVLAAVERLVILPASGRIVREILRFPKEWFRDAQNLRGTRRIFMMSDIYHRR